SFAVQRWRWPAAIPESGIVVGEAGAALDLQRWAASHTSRMVAAGGAEYFAALVAAAGHKAAKSRPQTQTPEHGEIQLFICGSASETTCSFAREAQAKGVPVFSLPESVGKGGTLSSEQTDALVTQVATALVSNKRAILNVVL